MLVSHQLWGGIATDFQLHHLSQLILFPPWHNLFSCTPVLCCLQDRHVGILSSNNVVNNVSSSLIHLDLCSTPEERKLHSCVSLGRTAPWLQLPRTEIRECGPVLLQSCNMEYVASVAKPFLEAFSGQYWSPEKVSVGTSHRCPQYACFWMGKGPGSRGK